MPSVQVIFYKETSGEVPFIEWVSNLSKRAQAKCRVQVERIHRKRNRYMRRKSTSDGLEILHRRYFEGKPKMMKLLEEERLNTDIGRKIYAVRTKAGLSQRALAKLIGTTASVVCRLENADYNGHSLSMLQRIADALDKRIEIRFVTKAVSGL